MQDQTSVAVDFWAYVGLLLSYEVVQTALLVTIIQVILRLVQLRDSRCALNVLRYRSPVLFTLLIIFRNTLGCVYVECSAEYSLQQNKANRVVHSAMV